MTKPNRARGMIGSYRICLLFRWKRYTSVYIVLEERAISKSGYRFCVRSRANFIKYGIDLIGEPVPTSPDHADHSRGEDMESDIYGYRARIGYTVAAVTTEVFPIDFYKIVPPGVSLMMVMLPLGERSAKDVEKC